MEGCLGTDTLVELVEGRAEPSVRARIEAHASRCEPCRTVLSSLARGSVAPEPPRGATRSLPAGTRVGRYVITGELGAGGMGVVYAAHDPELARTVAVKLLRGAGGAFMQERLRREAQAMAQLAHPNVVAVFDVGTFEDRTFVAMERVDGETLARWATAARSQRELLDAYRGAGQGLAAAHAAGIVHRDFKPENVLIAADGRARVVDFGLARAAGAPAVPPAVEGSSAPVSPDAPTIPADLTITGAIVGTPYYLAPECLRGEEADARSDQFSFCVALFTALYRERPFDGETYDELLANVAAGRIREPARRIPRSLRAAIRRGLAARPADRFATMEELLASLAPPSRRAWIAGAAALALVVPATIMLLQADAVVPCQGAAEHLRGIWDPPRKAAVAAALTGTGVPYATATWRDVEHTLDRYTDRWQAMHVQTCEATRVRGEQTEDVLELRMACLGERLQGLAGLLATFATADRSVVERAITAARDLPELELCADVAALRSPVRPPAGAAKAQVAQLRGELAQLRARRDAGIYASTLDAAKAVLGQARSLAYRPLEAEALAVVGGLERDLGRYVDARAAYEASLLAADAGRHDRQAAASLIELLAIVGHGLGKLDEVPALHGRARAALERIDHPPALEATLLETVGGVAIDAGKVADAERDLRAAAVAWERLHGPDDLRVVGALRSLARIELERERGAEALVVLDRVLAIQLRVLGDDHPDVGRTLSMQGGAHYAKGSLDEATALYQRALRIYERAVGPDSTAVANVLSNLASVYQAQGKREAAIELHRRATVISEHRLGAEHPTTLSYRSALAAGLADADRNAEALAILEEVLAVQRTKLGPAHQEIAMTLEIMAHTELGTESFAAARDHAREAKAMFERIFGAAYNPYIELRVLGEAHLGLGEAARACELLEQARGHVTADTDPGDVAWLESLLGRALIEAGRDRKRGLQLLASAWPRIAADARLTGHRDELAAWMAAHHIARPR